MNGEECKNCGSREAQSILRAPAFDSDKVAFARTYSVNRCSRCGIVSSVDVQSEDLEAAYRQDYYGASNAKFGGGIEGLIRLLARRRARGILQQWRDRSGRVGSNPKVLDIGCGRGTLLTAFLELGADAIGIERADFPLDPNLPISRETLDSDRFSQSRFDVVVIWHVLEHLGGTAQQLRLIRDHMQDDGLLVLAVPNFNSRQRRWFGGAWFHLDQPRHLVHLEDDWLIRELTEKGFLIETVSHIDWLQNCYGFIQSALNQLFPSRLNRLYRLLKYSDEKPLKHLLAKIGWCVPAGLLMPFAVAECLYSGAFGSGATIKLTARLAEKK